MHQEQEPDSPQSVLPPPTAQTGSAGGYPQGGPSKMEQNKRALMLSGIVGLIASFTLGFLARGILTWYRLPDTNDQIDDLCVAYIENEIALALWQMWIFEISVFIGTMLSMFCYLLWRRSKEEKR